jgi:endonuclease IV
MINKHKINSKLLSHSPYLSNYLSNHNLIAKSNDKIIEQIVN